MDERMVDPQEHDLLDRPRDPERDHQHQHRAPERRAGQLVGIDPAQDADTGEDVDQPQVEDLSDRPGRRADPDQRRAPDEQTNRRQNPA